MSKRASDPFTRADLDAMPEDGHRYELIDGLLIVSPAPRRLHQRAVLNMARLLESAIDVDHEVLVAPFDVDLGNNTVLEPDVLVAHDSAFTDVDLPGPPLLAVEVLSPSTRTYDLRMKKERYERAGCRHYWVVDPDEERPAISCWRLTDGRYQQVGHGVGDESVWLDQPFPIAITPSLLVRRHAAPPAR